MPNTSSSRNPAHIQTDLFSTGRPRGEGAWAVELGGRTVHYFLTLSPRARRVWLKIDPAGRLEVVVPRRMPLRGLEEIIKDKAGWILKRIGPADGSGETVSFTHGAAIPYLGTLYRLELVHGRGKDTSTRIAGGRIQAVVPDPFDPSSVRETVVSWYREVAAHHIEKRLRALGGGRKFGRVSIRDQKTRWGSCSSTGSMSFNWRVVMTPPDVVDYLVIHELVHLDRHDHSRKFWERVAELCPDYREHEAWLKNSGRALFAL